MSEEKPYVEKTVTNLEYNPRYGDDRVCVCGHAYYRHFDTHDDMYNCGCKYCGCHDFRDVGDEESLTRRRSDVNGEEKTELKSKYDFEHAGVYLKKTCSAYPEQYDAFAAVSGDMVQVGYLRLRHGEFTVWCPDPAGEEIYYSTQMNGDGEFEDDERELFLKEACEKVSAWRAVQDGKKSPEPVSYATYHSHVSEAMIRPIIFTAFLIKERGRNCTYGSHRAWDVFADLVRSVSSGDPEELYAKLTGD